MTIEKTPTESLIGYDADGIPPRHTEPATSVIKPDLSNDPLVYRCACCGWVYAKEASEGCVPGNCSQRPLPTRKYDPARYETEMARIIAPGKLLPPVPVVEPGFAGGTRPAISQADIFRSSGYRSPTVSPRDLDELDKQLEPLRVHRCRGCACALRPDQPCGSYCQRCNEELVSLESDCTSAWWSLPAWVLIGALAALGLAEVVVGVAWWWGSK